MRRCLVVLLAVGCGSVASKDAGLDSGPQPTPDAGGVADTGGGADTVADTRGSGADAADGPSRPDATGADAQGETAPARCDQPVSAGDCTGQIPKSCQELYSWGARVDGAYKLDPDGAGTNPPLVTYCEMNTHDAVGWTLMAKVNTASVDSVDEPDTWFITEGNTGMLANRTFIDNQPPTSHGAYKFAPLVSVFSVARFELYAQLDVTQKATWYKAVASAASLQSWFTVNDTTASMVCTDLSLSLNCTSGTIAPQTIGTNNATILAGMSLTPYGYTAGGAIHMRPNGDQLPQYSGVCSFTLDNDMNKWKDSYDTHWGNGLLIWLN
jgi:hypothetical protein